MYPQWFFYGALQHVHLLDWVCWVSGFLSEGCFCGLLNGSMWGTLASWTWRYDMQRERNRVSCHLILLLGMDTWTGLSWLAECWCTGAVIALQIGFSCQKLWYQIICRTQQQSSIWCCTFIMWPHCWSITYTRGNKERYSERILRFYMEEDKMQSIARKNSCLPASGFSDAVCLLGWHEWADTWLSQRPLV